MGTTNTHTHSLTYTDTCTPTHPPTHPQDLGERTGKGNSTGIHSIKLEITTLIEGKKDGEKKKLLSLYVLLTSEFTHNKFQKVC